MEGLWGKFRLAAHTFNCWTFGTLVNRERVNCLDFLNPKKTHHSQRTNRTRYLPPKPLDTLEATEESNELKEKLVQSLKELEPEALEWREQDEATIDKWRYATAMVRVKALHLRKSYFLPRYDEQMSGWRWRLHGTRENFSDQITSPVVSTTGDIPSNHILTEPAIIEECLQRFRTEQKSSLRLVREDWKNELTSSKSSSHILFFF